LLDVIGNALYERLPIFTVLRRRVVLLAILIADRQRIADAIRSREFLDLRRNDPRVP
jgi:hypothetical protein